MNQQRVKPAKEIHLGDVLEIQIGNEAWEVTVQGLSGRRGPAEEARTLYQESAESQAIRQVQREQRSLQVEPTAQIHGRPTKRDRRRLGRLTGG